MIRNKWSVGLRNQLATLAMECDSCAAIEGSRITDSERNYIQSSLRKVVDYIDDKICK